ncbi:MAG: hypothetical protein H6814_09425 [Phycisphaeraceae bacterium]|nr:hypothetical protein [Phycisphaeraceae bacterium]
MTRIDQRTLTLGALLAAAAIPLSSPAAYAGDRCGLTEDRTLLLWNSNKVESQAVRDLYLAHHPGVHELDLALTYNVVDISRSLYLSTIRQPVLDYLNSATLPDGTPMAQHIICIVTTRGLPARVFGQNEMSTFPISSYVSVESELTLLQQDLEQPSSGITEFRHWGMVDNPYHRRINEPISSFDRSQIQTQRGFTLSGAGAHVITGLTPGDFYLVCRVDSAPGATTTALEEIAALLDRSDAPSFLPAQVQALLDEYACADQLDDDRYGQAIGTSHDDFERVVDNMIDLGVVATHDQTADFIEQGELADPALPLLVFGTYGENHDAGGCGDDPPGVATYLSLYPDIHPAAVMLAYESFSGNSILNGMPRQGQGQALEFFPAGGTFTFGNVAEPYSFSLPDLEIITDNLYLNGLTWAEAFYSALPALSWQQTMLGDPLARVRIETVVVADLNNDGVVDTADLGQMLGAFGTSSRIADINGDCEVDTADLGILLSNFGN